MKNIHVLPTDKPSRLYCHSLSKTLMLWHLKNGISKSPSFSPQNIYITNDEEIKKGEYRLHIPSETISKWTGDGSLRTKEYKKIVLTDNPDLIKDGVQKIDDEFLEWFVKNSSCEEVEVKCYSKFNDGDFTDYKIIIPKEESKQENKVLVEMQQILRRDSKFMGHYESCDLCHYNAFFKYLYNGEILYRCQGHKIVNINNLKSKFGFGNEEPKQETLEEAAYDFTAGKSVKEIYSRMDFVKGAKFGAKWQAEQDKNKYSEEEVLDIINQVERFINKDKSTFTEIPIWFIEQFKKK